MVTFADPTTATPTAGPNAADDEAVEDPYTPVTWDGSHPLANSVIARHYAASTSPLRHGFTIEVGPVPQGVVRHDAVEKTERALHALLEFMQCYNDDATSLDKTLRSMYEKNKFRVPCFKSATASRKQEMSGRISWDSVPENPNIPSLMVHKNLQDKDYQQVRTGDPLFVDLDGVEVPYDGAYGSPIYVIVSEMEHMGIF